MNGSSQTASETQAVFHDIKPLAEFYPAPRLLFWGLGILLVAMLLLRFARFFPPRKKSEVKNTVSAWEVFLEAVDNLKFNEKANEEQRREFATSLSRHIRQYLGDSLGLNAEELCVSELEPLLDFHVKKKLSALPKARLDKLLSDILQQLRILEKNTFADSIHLGQLSLSQQLISDTKNSLAELQRFLESERQKRISVQEV